MGKVTSDISLRTVLKALLNKQAQPQVTKMSRLQAVRIPFSGS